MAKCSFCGNEIPKGTGLMYIKDDTTIFYFDKHKCRMNLLKLRRNPKKSRWTHFFVKTTTKEKSS